jgi:hypothetical protein
MFGHRSRRCHSDESVMRTIGNCRAQKDYRHPRKRKQIMNETSSEKPSPWDQPGDGHPNKVANANRCWKENLKDNMLIVLLGSVALSFTLGYFIAQQQDAKKREQWAEILFRQAKDWLTESGRKTAGAVEHGVEYARSAAEQAASKGTEYRRGLNPFHRELRRRFFGIL